MASQKTAIDELQRKYSAALIGRVESIKEQYLKLDLSHWDNAAVRELHHMLHNLTGSAGTFGMHSLSSVARKLETQIKPFTTVDNVPSKKVFVEIGQEVTRLEKLSLNFVNARAPELIPPQAIVASNRSPLVYLVEDNADQADHMASALQEVGFKVKSFADQESFRSSYDIEACPDAIILDLMLPEGDYAGLELLEEIKSQSCCPPVVVISVRDDFEARRAAYQAGAARYLQKPADSGALIELMNILTNRIPPEPYKILLIDDDPIILEVQAEPLKAAGMSVKMLSNPKLVFDALDEFRPDVLVLDVFMPEIKGPDLAAIIRERDEYLQLPIIFVSAETDIDEQMKALNLGGDDFLVKPVQPDHLVSAVTARTRRARQNVALHNRLKATLYEREREHLALNQFALVSVTDGKGDIISVNDMFCDVSGYSRSELLGQNHRIVKSNEHPSTFYHDLWQTISNGNIWHGEICNRAKDGSLYWVASTITPFLDETGQPYQYVSIRTDVTEKRRAQQEVQSVKEVLRLGQQYANIGTWEWDIVSGDLYWTERIAPLFGHPVGELETSFENFMQAVHPEDRHKVQAAVSACIESDTPYDIEHRVIWPDGTTRWLLERGAVMRDHKGKPLKMLGVVQDIDDRKVAEFKLHEREQLLLEAQHLASLGNWRANLITGELYWSDEIFRIFGYEPNSFSPTVSVFKAAVHPDDIELVEQDIKNAELTGRHDVIHRILLPDGEVRFVHELAHMQYDESGQPWCLVGTVQDVTELKKAEQDLLVFRRVFESTEQGIGVTNAEGYLLYSNPAHDDLHGYEPGECLGEHFNIFFSEKTKHWANDTIMSAISEGRGWSGILPIVRKDGREVITASNVGFIADDKGSLQYLFNIMSDYGPELERQSQLENAREEAEQANQAKSEFLSSMSHELRTPLNAILGFGQVLQYDDRMHPDQQGSVQEILSGGKHLLELINEVLDLAKIESGHLELRIASLELCSLVKECMTLIKPLADKRGIELSHEGIGGLMIKADRTRLKQVLLNLLSNAVKYNREEGRVHIHIQNDERDQLRIGVSDTGEGLSEDQVAQLFQAFNRLDFKNSKVEGTGIGLTITKRIVEMMDGEIDVESEVGVGTTFWVDLPVGDEKETSLSHKASALQATPETHDKPASQHTLLYIEDNASNLKLVEKILGHKANLTLLTAETPEKGIELAFKRFPSLILLDINMPRMDGYKVLKVLQSNPKLNKTPVIAITANAMGHDIERGKEAGFVDYLTKPLDVEQFLSAIDKQLNP